MADLTPLNSNPSIAPSSRRSTGTSHSGLDYYFSHAAEGSGSGTPGSPAGAHIGISGGQGMVGSASRPGMGMERIGGVSAFSSSSSLGIPVSPSVYAQARRQGSGPGSGDGVKGYEGAMGSANGRMEEIRTSIDANSMGDGAGKEGESTIPSPGVWSSDSSSYSFGYDEGTLGRGMPMASPAVQVWANDAAAALRDETDANTATEGSMGAQNGQYRAAQPEFTYPFNMSKGTGTSSKSSYNTGNTGSTFGTGPGAGAGAGNGSSGTAVGSMGPNERTPVAATTSYRSDVTTEAGVQYHSRQAGNTVHASSPGAGGPDDFPTPTMNQGTPACPSPSRYTPTSGRPVFNVAPTSPSSPHYTSTGVMGGSSSRPTGMGAYDPANAVTQSAPAWKSDFGLAGLGMGPVSGPSSEVSTVAAVGVDDFGIGKSGSGEGEETIKAREKRSTLPDMAHLSPVSSRTGEERARGRGSSPVPPPRSTLRNQLAALASPIPNLDLYTPPSPGPSSHNITPPELRRPQSATNPSPPAAAPVLVHPVPPTTQSRSQTLPPPAITSEHTAPRLDRLSSKDSTTISDLAELLGGAIDEIGLMDSRATSPPIVGADPRDKAQGGSAGDAMGESPSGRPEGMVRQSTDSSMTDRSSQAHEQANEGHKERARPHIPGRHDSLTRAAFTPLQSTSPGPVPAISPNGVARTKSSGATSTYSSLTHATNASNVTRRSDGTSGTYEPKPWPAAMLYGHIRNMKHSGDRAKAYARGINELARADSGLVEWCAMSTMDKLKSPSIRISSYSTHQPQYPSTSSASTVYAPGPGSTNTFDFLSYHPRTVSASSEFPMRDDHQTAREISQRVIDPAEPTGLPPNLPYPQIQHLNQAQRSFLQAPSSLRPSPSTHSVASVQSGFTTNSGSTGYTHVPAPAPAPKRGFFSALRSRKDPGLGPPTGAVPVSNIKDLPISAPAPSAASFQAARNGGITAPIGPRAQSTGPGSSAAYQVYSRKNGLGDQTTPTRASFDVSAVSSAFGYGKSANRGSLDSSRISQSPGLSRNGTPRASVDRAMSASPAKAVDEADVRAVADVLPHVEKGVLRAYLARYGDQMGAISAYLEDEKRGAIRR